MLEYLRNKRKPTMAANEEIRQFQQAIALGLQVPLSYLGLDEFNEEIENAPEQTEGSNT